jgi:hypothetical protein
MPSVSGRFSVERWKCLFEAALLERDPEILPKRLLDAKHAVMDHIEDSFKTASVAERRLLSTALNTISELQRLSDTHDSPRAETTPALDQAA